MSAVRFQSTPFPSERGTEIVIEIWDSDFVGSPTSFNTDSTGYRLGYSANGFEQSAQFMATQCEFTYWIANATDFAIITDFATSQESRFLVRILEDSVMVWTGIILLDISSYEEKNYPFAFNIRAVDGLGTLKDVPFKDVSGGYTGKSKIVEFLTRALSKITYVSEFYTTGDVFLRSSIDWWEETMTNSPTGSDLLNQAYLSNSVYYKYNKGVLDFVSCYDVIRDILTAFESRITYADGAFYVEQLSYRRTAITVRRAYETDGSFINATNYAVTSPLLQNSAGALLATGQYEFSAPISEATHTFKANERRNFFAGAENIDEQHTGIETFNVPIHGNNGSTTLRLTGSLKVTISSDNPDPSYLSPLKPFAGILRINLELATEGIQRTYTLQPSYQVTYDAPIWSATPGLMIVQPFSGPFLANTTSDIFTFAQMVDVMTPPLPENTESFTFSIGFIALERFDGGTYSLSDFTITYDLNDLWLEAYSYGTPVLNDDAAEYTTLNTDTNNTLIWKSESLIGSSVNPNTGGAIWVKPASDYVLAGLWGEGTNTPTYSYIGQLLTTIICATHAKPAKKLNGTLYGDIVALSSILWDSRRWILIGGTWNAVNNLFDGEWFEMRYAEGLSPSPPIKIKHPTYIGPGKKIIDTATVTPSGILDSPITVPKGTWAYVVAQTLTSTDIAAGVYTSIPIQNTLADNDFRSGDIAIIVDPFSGVFEELTVTANTTAGQTALAVSGTLLHDYPEGSPMVRKDRIGSGNSLPGAVDGQILRRTSGKWAGYGSGAITDGHVLTWDTTNGWQAEALSSSGITALTGDVTATGPGSVAATIAANAVTLAKMAQVATATFLGRTTAGTGNVEALTVTQATALLNIFTSALKGLVPASGGGTSNYLRADGSWAAPVGTGVTQSTTLVTGRVTLSAGSNSITDNALLRFDGTRLAIGAGTQTGFLDVFAGALSGTQLFYNASANVSGAMVGQLVNASTAGHSFWILKVGGTAAGDPFIQYTVTGGVGTWSVGVDNSDGDKFKHTPNASTPGGTLNSGLIITNEVAAKVGINRDAPLYPLDAAGVVRSTQFVGQSASWSSANVSFGTGNGTGGAVNSITGTLNSIQINWNTGTTPTNNALVMTVTYPTAFPSGLTFPVMMAKNALSATDFSKFYISNNSSTSFQITANGTLAYPGNYSFNLLIGGIG